ncbi:MAG: 3-deoxy-7-phosphoheptulonate synthase [Deltaproteobacteria bacterium]|nr:3-deoxy-7-phosphoheptulonate synthase [Deltaproteobacteria bacterium]
MDLKTIINTNVAGFHLLPSPNEIQKQLPASEKSLQTIAQGRQHIKNILDGKDSRLFVVIGPCSIHDPKAALEYAERLSKVAREVEDQLLLVMRVYFEKPRTTVGWKGLINDPHMDDSFQIETGIKMARQILLQVTDLGLPTATEALDPIMPQYLAELISWSAIGARTTESQTHREMASGLSTPVGFKNGTDGNIQVAINAMKSALSSHHFLGIDGEGRISVVKTKGNAYSHVVLRGGNSQPNFDPESVQKCEEALQKEGLLQKIMIDCSHGNSNKDHRRQPAVFESVIQQVLNGNQSIVGMMVESHLFEGSQSIPQDLSQLKYGVSVTDKCIDWETTEKMLRAGHALLKKRANS